MSQGEHGTSTDNNQDKVGAVMVVGAGIGGMNASLDLAESGYKVFLVEETSSIGGRMAQLDKTFPTNDCSMCTISPKLIEVAKHLNIEILTNTSVEQVEGEAGRFKVTVAGEPRYIDLDKCNACGDCEEVCPVRLPSEFDEDLGERRAIHRRYPQAIPSTYAISKRDRAPCRDGCPAHTNVHAYVSLTKEGKFQEALDVIRRRIPLPGTLGRICHHPCEAECRRAEVDSPISIAAIKRHAADHADLRKGAWQDPAPVERPAGKRIAVVGSGPAGLTAADDLSAMGYEVTLFEASDELGGMLRHGIPHYRLPREVLDREIKVITDDERVQVRTGVRTSPSANSGSRATTRCSCRWAPRRAAASPCPARTRTGCSGASSSSRRSTTWRRCPWATAWWWWAAATWPWTWPAPPAGWAPRWTSSAWSRATRCLPARGRSRRPWRRAAGCSRPWDRWSCSATIGSPASG
jgi:ferredoxin